jgi:outer membrane protein
MFKKILISILSILPFSLMAQNATELKFGHVNTQEIVLLMPQMKEAQAQLEAMSKQYEDEIAKMTEELQSKYKDFQAMKNVDEAIMKTRQDELVALNQRIDLMKQTATEQIQKKQDALVAPILDLVKKAINEIGAENGFMYIYDTSYPIIAYISPNSVDITPMLRKKLNIPANATPLAASPRSSGAAIAPQSDSTAGAPADKAPTPTKKPAKPAKR